MVRVRLLGPFSVDTSNGPTRSLPRRHQKILALLLLEAGQSVAVSTLIDELWQESPPHTAVDQVNNGVAAIRRFFVQTGITPGLIFTSHAGIRLDRHVIETDVGLVERFVAAARVTADPLKGADRLRSGLCQWSGPSLAGLTGPRLSAAAARFDEWRLSLTEDLLEQELMVGDTARLVPTLLRHIAEHPLRERFAEQLMIAQFRAGRTADALTTYQKARARLHDDLGIEPGTMLSETHRMILRGDDPRTAAGTNRFQSAPRVPAELPRRSLAFTGRQEEIETLDHCLAGGQRRRICAISGGPGAGKTSLAIEWAHRQAGKFPDGHLWIDLHGDADTQIAPAVALNRILRSLGVASDEISAELDAAITLFRTVVFRLRLLIVLDNAASAAQVEPLLPNGDDCGVVVTSRSRLDDLVLGYGAEPLDIAGLGPHEANLLITRALRDQRPLSEPDATARLAQLCGFMPLALRVSVARLAQNPFLTISEEVAALEASQAESVVDFAESPMRLAFERSYRALADEDQRMIQRLALMPGRDIPLAGAAVLGGLEPSTARRSLLRLANAHLVEQCDRDRYAMHDELRRYSRDLSNAAEDATHQLRARARLLSWYADTTVQAAGQAYVGMARFTRSESSADPFNGAEDAREWLDEEQANILAIIEHEAYGEDPGTAVTLIDQLRGHLIIQGRSPEWIAAAQAGVHAATRTPDLIGRAAAHICLALAYRFDGRHYRSIAHNRRAIRYARLAGSVKTEANALASLGLGLSSIGRMAAACESYRAALAMNRQQANNAGVSAISSNLALALGRLGSQVEALGHVSEALVINEEAGNRHAITSNRIVLGEILLSLGRSIDAHEQFTLAADLADAAGRTIDRELARRWLARTLIEHGRLPEALTFAHEALRIAESHKLDGPAGATYQIIGLAHHAAGEPATALEYFSFAIKRATQLGEQYHLATALHASATSHQAEANYSAALSAGLAAVETARANCLVPIEAAASLSLAEAFSAVGKQADAVHYAQQALRIYASIDDPTPHARIERIIR